MAAEHHAGRDAERRAGAGAGGHAPPSPFLWPLIWSASAGAAAASLFESAAQHWLALGDDTPPEPEWTTPNTVALELPSMRLRDFGKGERGRPTIVCAPYALHGATIVDFAPGHSLVEALRRGGLARPLVTDWRSATPEMRFFSIDTYLADLNVAVDELTPPVDLVGLCQGGWLALVYAARFPGKVGRLVLAGAPVDIDAAESPMSRAVRGLPLSTFESLVRLGDGRVLGRYVREAWAPALDAADAGHVLQAPAGLEPDRLRELEARFRHWYAWTVDLPGPYYLQAVDLLYRQNQIAQGRFVALGRRIDLADVRAPLFLLAARDDEIVPAEQLFAAAHLVGSADGAIETAIEPCGHLGLFLGAGTLGGAWTRIAHWLCADRLIAKAS